MTYTFKLARRLAVSRMSSLMTSILPSAFSPTEAFGQLPAVFTDVVPQLAPSGFTLVALVLLGFFAIASLSVLARWLLTLQSPLPWHLLLLVIVTTGVFAQETISLPRLLTRSVTELTGPPEDAAGVPDTAKLDYSHRPGPARETPGGGSASWQDTLLTSSIIGLVLFPLVWRALRRWRSQPGLVRILLPFALAFFLSASLGVVLQLLLKLFFAG